MASAGSTPIRRRSGFSRATGDAMKPVVRTAISGALLVLVIAASPGAASNRVSSRSLLQSTTPAPGGGSGGQVTIAPTVAVSTGNNTLLWAVVGGVVGLVLILGLAYYIYRQCCRASDKYWTSREDSRPPEYSYLEYYGYAYEYISTSTKSASSSNGSGASSSDGPSFTDSASSAPRHVYLESFDKFRTRRHRTSASHSRETINSSQSDIPWPNQAKLRGGRDILNYHQKA